MSHNEELQALDNEYATLSANLDYVHSLAKQTMESRKIDRFTMEAAMQAVPAIENEDIPLNSYSKDPTEQNLEASLESFSVAQFLTVLAIGAVLGAALLVLINLTKKDRLNERVDAVSKAGDKIKQTDRDIDTKTKSVSGKNDSAADKALAEAIRSGNLSSFAGDMPKASAEAARLLQALDPKGVLGKEMLTWAVKVPDQYKGLSKRFKDLKKTIDQMYKAKGEDAVELARRLSTARLDSNDPFLLGMANLESKWNEVLGGESFANVLVRELVETEDFAKLAMQSETWLASYMRMIPNNIDRLDREIESLEKEASELERYKKSVQDASRKKGVTTYNDDGSIRHQQQALTADYTLTMEVAKTERVIKQEIQCMVLYRKMLNRLVLLQQKLVSTRQKLQGMQLTKLNELEGKA
jgi:hypothetical protein